MFEYAGDIPFDILLLDIEMGGMNGVELARRMRTDGAVPSFTKSELDKTHSGAESYVYHYPGNLK